MYRLDCGLVRLSRGILYFLIVLMLVTQPANGYATSILSSSDLAARDQVFLEDLERRSFQYFLDQSDARDLQGIPDRVLRGRNC